MFIGLPGHWMIGSVVSLGIMGATLIGAGAGLGKGLTIKGCGSSSSSCLVGVIGSYRILSFLASS